MFGSNFANYNKIIIDSFQKTSHAYEKKTGFKKYNLILKPYIKIFGVPEIGFQLRARYFFDRLNKIPRFKPKNILDAGSGIGFYSFVLAKRYPKAEVLGIDIDKEKLDFCKRYAKENNIENVQFKNQDLVTFKKYKDKFDKIVNIDILEHIDNYKQVLKNFYNLLDKDGYLYIHTPKSNQKGIFKKFFSEWHHEDHVREGFDPEGLKKELLKVGFKSVKTWGGFGFWGKLSWELYHIALSKSFILAGLIYPILYLISKIDSGNDNDGLTIILLAKK